MLGLYGLDYGYAMQGKITLDQVYDMLNKKSDPKNSFENMLMLVGVYFPRLRGVLTELLSCRESLTSLVARFERGYKNGEIDGARFLPEFNKVVDHLGGIEKKFKDEIVREADFINRPWMRLWPYLRDNKGKRVLL